jgi:hypothetical protein
VTRRGPLLQLKELPINPFNPDFLPQMGGLNSYITSQAEARTSQLLFQHLLALGYIPALLQRLLPLAGCIGASSPAAESSSSLVTEGTPSGQDLDSSAPPPALAAGAEELRAIVAEVTLGVSLAFCLQAAPRGGSHEYTYPAPVLAAIEQAMSDPACLTVALHCGLSAEAQVAAAGGDATARACMRAVISLFRMVATKLWGVPNMMEHSACSEEDVVRALASFLGLEANLPFLELLCLHHVPWTIDGDGPTMLPSSAMQSCFTTCPRPPPHDETALSVHGQHAMPPCSCSAATTAQVTDRSMLPTNLWHTTL